MTPMDSSDRPAQSHRSGGADLFICFAPRRPAKPVRLRSSGSVKGAQSPAIFPPVSKTKKKGSTFETTAEPSSPKVSCIGQVRVKTTRRMKKNTASELRSRSRRSESGKDSSFRRVDSRELVGSSGFCFPSKNQSWVHLPLGNICDGIKAFGSDLNCFKSKGPSSSSSSWCCSCSCACGGCGGRRKRTRACSCRTAFARCWAMEIEGGDEEIEREEERDVAVVMRDRGSRRGMRELELLADELEKGKLQIQGERDEDPACVPPKNALLLMRCKSDPTRMSSLGTRVMDRDVDSKVVLEEQEQLEEEEDGGNIVVENGIEEVMEERNSDPTVTMLRNGEIEEKDRVLPSVPVRKVDEEAEKENKEEVKKRDIKEKEERRRSFKKEKGMGRRSTSYKEGRRSSFSTEGEARRSSFEKEGKRRWSFSSEKDARRGKGAAPVEKKAPATVEEGEKKGELPDCLLLMMYEPKLSMEVSKETWVCTADFLRWQPNHHRKQEATKQQEINSKMNAEEVKAETSNLDKEDEKNKLPDEAGMESLQPVPWESIPPKPTSVGNATVEKGTYGPFALMRCKSEPAKSSVSGHASLDGCFWRSRHLPVGTAGVGF